MPPRVGTLRPLSPVSLDEVRAAQVRLKGKILETPLIPFDVPGVDTEIYVKLESLQPIGSFKLRGAGNAMAMADPEQLRHGVYTASAGNMAQGVANARELGIPCRVVVPEGAPALKIDATTRMGAEVITLPFDDWWQVLVDHGHPEIDGLFIHPVSDPAVIAGNGTVGLEILEQLPELTAVIVSYGGGGLSCGIASTLRELRPEVPVYGAEVETATPLAAALAAGEPTTVDWSASFVDGIGSKRVLDEMWPMARDLLAGSLVSSLAEVEAAVRALASYGRVVAEGAGATAVAAAMSGKAGPGPVVAVLSGGNIDPTPLGEILAGP